jgi:biopolymer transport protein ExbD
MQQRHVLRQKTGTDLNITPMIDVIFILLIFFLATTSFVKETGVEVERPSAATAERQERGNILIAISENGDIWMGGRMLDIRTVRANVEQALAENPEAAVIITADKSSTTGLLIQVMDQARLAGVSTVSIAAIKE